MAAFVLGKFDYLAANTSASIYMSPYGDQEAAAQCVVVTGFSAPGVLNPLGKARLTVNEVTRGNDGKIGRLFTVQNVAPFNPCTISILELFESF
jgi:hypothetical protein